MTCGSADCMLLGMKTNPPTSPLNKPEHTTTAAVEAPIPSSTPTLDQLPTIAGGTFAGVGADSADANIPAEANARDPQFVHRGNPTGFDGGANPVLVDELQAAQGVTATPAQPTKFAPDGRPLVDVAPGVKHIEGTEIVSGGPTQQ